MRYDEPRDDAFVHRHVAVGEVRLHVVEARPEGAGVEEARLVVLLHGFPELWWSWHRQLRALAEAGFWAVAPDLRGYGESDRPSGVGAYELEALAGDVAGLIRALGRTEAIVVGHDWGAMVAWAFANEYPEMLERLAIVNVPHPLVMLRGLRRPAQLRKSWYIFFFQLPLLPERLLSHRDFAFLRHVFRADGVPERDVERYVAALRAPGALTAAIHYYRASLRRLLLGRLPTPHRVDRPVLVVWGDRDRVLGKELAEPPPDLVPHARVVHLADASHWVQSAAPETLTQLLLSFFAEAPAPQPSRRGAKAEAGSSGR